MLKIEERKSLGFGYKKFKKVRKRVLELTKRFSECFYTLFCKSVGFPSFCLYNFSVFLFAFFNKNVQKCQIINFLGIFLSKDFLKVVVSLSLTLPKILRDCAFSNIGYSVFLSFQTAV